MITNIYMFSLGLRTIFTAHSEREKQAAIDQGGFVEIPEYVHKRFEEAQRNGTLGDLIESYNRQVKLNEEKFK